MRLKNVLIVVNDIEKSKQFYKNLFGLETVQESEGYMILTEGLVLQDKKIWREFLGKEVSTENNACELYFEENDMESFVQTLEYIYPSAKYLHKLISHNGGQKSVRFYDPDGHLIEVRSPAQRLIHVDSTKEK